MKRVETIGFEIKTISNLIKRKINESPFEFNDLTGMQCWILKDVYKRQTYYYSEIKAGGKLYSKPVSGEGEPKKINDDVPISINIYHDKLYYINCAQKDKSPVVVLDIQDTSKREVLQDRDAMKMLIKDDKIIIAYIGEEGRGHVEGYYYIYVEVSDLKSGEVIDTYSPGYGLSLIHIYH